MSHLDWVPNSITILEREVKELRARIEALEGKSTGKRTYLTPENSSAAYRAAKAKGEETDK